ncbi:PRP3-domain-containing protein [Ascodesmis nigricans]|uniref:PRP3-domain-containing protein n=1 Tax=Ascodesmis nigricans TaxID=341454 RepID=A0A4V3SJ72_9PEZI|nr:PRP3-domain-containing protein [Ascodesmis nigricans]
MASSPQRKRPPPDDGLNSPSKKPRAAPDQERIQKMVAEARERAMAMAAKLAAQKGGQAPAPSSAAPALQSAAERLAAMRARVSSAVSRSTAIAPARPAPGPPSIFRPPEPEPESQRARGGLDVGLHPALLGDVEAASSARGKKPQPKFATTMANRSGSTATKAKKQLDLSGPSADVFDPTKNPYFDPNIASKAASTRRVPKTLVFNQKGKYIEQANALRRQQALEEMKKRIAASARKVGIDEDMHADKAFAPPEPPTVEWWDQGLISTPEYDELRPENLKIDTPDSIITIYIQHPILIEPPQDRLVAEAKPLPLTKEEMAKKRRQARAAALKVTQAKIRLGLEAPPPPKVRKANMMRVLGEEAVKDPTAVEARVNREIRERFDKHVETNESRKLTKEQKLEKLALNQQKDAAKGIKCLVFRIENLSDGRHQFKINKNAEQLAITGICIHNPKFNVVIVEGGEHSIKKYKKLMLNRIKWTEKAEPREGSEPADVVEGSVDLENNKCTLVWEGELKQRGFKKFTSEKCPTEAMAKERLERAKMEHLWTLARTSVPRED